VDKAAPEQGAEPTTMQSNLPSDDAAMDTAPDASADASTGRETPAITKDMLIGDIVAEHPEVIETLLAEGVHCIGCGASAWETLEQGLAVHGKTPEEIDTAVAKLNAAAIASGDADEGHPRTGLTITSAAAAKVKEFASQQDSTPYGLRVEVLPGGCAGFQYALEFTDTREEDDLEFEQDGVRFVVNKASMSMLEGAKIDFLNTLNGAGFKITNPNANKSCGCGNSFG